MIISLLSDTHNKHKHIHNKGLGDLKGGDLILHAGDISSMGHKHEIIEFIKWYNQLEYTNRIFIAGNHDWDFYNNYDEMLEVLSRYNGVNYIQDKMRIIRHGDSVINIYGSPWQPEFNKWAFNLPRNGPGLAYKWESIPNDTDILITHSPAFGILDTVEGRRNEHLGCELLTERVKEIKPKIHVCGHIHSGYGYYFDGNTHFFNAAVLNEQYIYTQKPFTFEWNPDTNEINF